MDDASLAQAPVSNSELNEALPPVAPEPELGGVLGLVASAFGGDEPSGEDDPHAIGGFARRTPGSAVEAEAAAGVAGGGGKLPFLDQIQASFGHHDVSGVGAHFGSAAEAAGQSLGAKAFAIGGDVAFAEAPDLHTAAHEAAHTIQNAGGVQTKAIDAGPGDRQEQDADAVADLVVRGQDAEPLLDRMAGTGGPAVQRSPASGGGGVEYFVDGGNYEWRRDADGSFTLVAHEGTEKRGPTASPSSDPHGIYDNVLAEYTRKKASGAVTSAPVTLANPAVDSTPEPAVEEPPAEPKSPPLTAKDAPQAPKTADNVEGRSRDGGRWSLWDWWYGTEGEETAANDLVVAESIPEAAAELEVEDAPETASPPPSSGEQSSDTAPNYKVVTLRRTVYKREKNKPHEATDRSIPAGTVVNEVEKRDPSIRVRWTQDGNHHEGWVFPGSRTPALRDATSEDLDPWREEARAAAEAGGTEEAALPEVEEELALSEGEQDQIRAYRDGWRGGVWGAIGDRLGSQSVAGAEGAEEEDAGGPTRAWLTVLAERGAYVHREIGGGGGSLGTVYPGDRLPSTGQTSEADGSSWVEVKLGGEIGNGWIAAADTNAETVLGLVAEQERSAEARVAAIAVAESYADAHGAAALAAVEDEPVGLTVVGRLVARKPGVAVFSNAFSTQQIGTVPAAPGVEGLTQILPELSGSDSGRREILYGKRPGYVPAGEVRDATEVDLLMAKDRLTDEEIGHIREAIARGEVEPARRPLAHQKIQEFGGGVDGDEQQATFGGQHAQGILQFASCLRTLGVPNPYPNLSYADAVEAVRLERGLPADASSETWAAFSAAFGVQSQPLRAADPGLVLTQLLAGRSVMVNSGGTWLRVRKADGASLTLDGQSEPLGHEDANAARAHVFAVPSEVDASGADARREAQGLALDAEQTREEYADLYARTSTAESRWYVGAVGRDGERSEVSGGLAAHTVSAADADRMAVASLDKVREAFRRLLLPGTPMSAAAEAASLLQGMSVAPEQSDEVSNGLEGLFRELQSWVHSRASGVFREQGPDAAVTEILSLGEPRVAGTPVVTEEVRDLLKLASMSVLDEGATAAPSGDVDHAAVHAVPFESAYGSELRDRMEQAAGEVESVGSAADDALVTRLADGGDAGRMPTDGDVLRARWYRGRFARLAGHTDIANAYAEYFLAVEQVALHDRAQPLQHSELDALAVALELADILNVPHSWRRTAEERLALGDVTDPRQRAAAVAGNDIDKLKTVVCSEFTILSLVRAGWDMRQLYRDPTSGLPVGYLESATGPLKLIDLYMVTNNQRETSRALLDLQQGDAERIEPGDERMKGIQRVPGEPFWLAEKGDLIDSKARDGDVIGAALTAVALGGRLVEPAERKPGDLHQSARLENGKHKGGHSALVKGVRGHGVAWLGAGDSPQVIGAVRSPAPLESLAPGWYRIEPGSGLAWEVDETTSPSRVASLVTTHAQLVDANENRGDDATGVGSMQAEKDRSVEQLSTGRLPNSRWFAWSGSDVADAPVLQTRAAGSAAGNGRDA